MSDMDLFQARQEVRDLIRVFEGRRAARDRKIARLKRGKLYEFFVLSWVLGELRGRGFAISLHGAVLSLKQSPSKIDPRDTYFKVTHVPTGVSFRVYTDVEVRTLGSTQVAPSDLSSYHEIDIVVVDETARDRPSYRQLALGIECKSNVKFRKSILKEALGIKRVTALLRSHQPSLLAQVVGESLPSVPSDPPSEYYVCYVDPDGDRYAESPSVFGIEFKNLRP